jgi:SAM-dependent methyltransferase
MDEQSWNQWAKDFENHVFDICDLDTQGVFDEVMGVLAPVRRRQGVLVDLGCGRGTFIRRYAKRFGHCVGSDFSEQMIVLAIRKNRHRHASFTRSPAETFRVPRELLGDVVACFNVGTSPKAAGRKKIWKSVHANMKPKGAALIVVPALESAEWTDAVGRERGLDTLREIRRGGIVRTDGVDKKFFTEGEIRAELKSCGFKKVEVRKVWFGWWNEGVDGRQVRKLEQPWDWLAVARK